MSLVNSSVLIIFWSLVTSPIFIPLGLLSKNDHRSEEDERIMSEAVSLQFVYNKGIAKRFKLKALLIFLVHLRRPRGTKSTMPPQVPPKYLRWNISCCKWRRDWADWSPKLDYKLLEIGKLVFVVATLSKVPGATLWSPWWGCVAQLSNLDPISDWKHVMPHLFSGLAPVVQKLDSPIHWIVMYSLDNAIHAALEQSRCL